MKHFLLFSFLVILVHQSFAQRHCATEELHKQKKLNNPELYKLQEDYKKELTKIAQNKKAKKLSGIAGVNDIYTIPVVVHVVYNDNSATNISDAQVVSQIQVLNEDFRRMAGTNGFNTNPIGDDVKIEFCLASSDPSGNYSSGILRVYHPESAWTANFSHETLIKSLSIWPTDQYLNIWVCQMDPLYLGYAQYPVGAAVPGPTGSGPELDGVVIDFRAFGRTGTAGTGGHSLYNLGRTTTHEVGHWLGLLHIWGEDDVFGCSNDYVADTPIDKGPNVDTDCNDESDCDGDLIFTPDLTENYLDYSPDVCMNLFTTGQKDRMRAVMESAPRRMALLSSQGCCFTAQTAADVPFSEDFEGGDTLFSIIPSNGAPKWEIMPPGGFGESMYGIVMENDIASVGEVDTLESGFIRFGDIQPVMEFDLAYARNSFTFTDSLVISYSLNCSVWTPILILDGNSLATTSRITDNFIPQANEWKTITVDLEPLNYKPLGRVKFENYSKAVNNVYIDNINIYNTSSTLKVNVYPNPTSGTLNLEVLLKDTDNVTFELFDVLGQKVFEQTDYEQHSYTKSIDLSGLARGVYIVRVRDSKQKVTKKIIYSY